MVRWSRFGGLGPRAILDGRRAPSARARLGRTRRHQPTLLGSGVGTFVVGYAPSVVVGIVGDHKGDDNLFIPVVGPWLNLGKRDCSGATVLTSNGPYELASRSNCGTSDIERAALIASGVVQGAGVLQMLGSLFVPQRRVDVVVGSRGPSFSVTPTYFRGGGERWRPDDSEARASDARFARRTESSRVARPDCAGGAAASPWCLWSGAKSRAGNSCPRTRCGSTRAR